MGTARKIAFVGTHGTGKTTLTYQLAGEFRRRGHNVEVLKEVARECPLPINEGTTIEAQWWILFRQMALEIECAARCEVIICDRSVLDNYAYLRRAFGPQERLEAFLVEWMRSYDEVVFVPVSEGRLAADGVRSTDERFQAEIDAAVRALLETAGVPFDVLPARRSEWLRYLCGRFEARGLLAAVETEAAA